MTADPRLIVPLDLPTVDEARDMVDLPLVFLYGTRAAADGCHCE